MRAYRNELSLPLGSVPQRRPRRRRVARRSAFPELPVALQVPMTFPTGHPVRDYELKTPKPKGKPTP